MPDTGKVKWIMPICLSMLAVIVLPTAGLLYNVGGKVAVICKEVERLASTVKSIDETGTHHSQQRQLVLQGEVSHVQEDVKGIDLKLDALREEATENKLMLREIKTLQGQLLKAIEEKP